MNKYILALTLVTSFSTNTASAMLIDDFTDGLVHIDADSYDNVQSSITAFGGERAVSITKSGAGGAKVDVITGLGGLYVHSADALTSAMSTISWSNGSGIDLIENTNNGFSLDIVQIDQGEVTFILSVTDSGNTSESFSLLDAGTGIQNIAFTSFTGINFHQVTDISLQIVGGLESDLVLSSLQTTVAPVPVPPALFLFTSSLALLSYSRRKTKI